MADWCVVEEGNHVKSTLYCLLLAETLINGSSIWGSWLGAKFNLNEPI